MGFLEKGWMLVEDLFYEEKAAITAAKYYLYLYFVDVLGVRSLHQVFLKLEKEVFIASYTFLVFFMSSMISRDIQHHYPYPDILVLNEKLIEDLRRLGIKVEDKYIFPYSTEDERLSPENIIASLQIVDVDRQFYYVLAKIYCYNIATFEDLEVWFLLAYLRELEIRCKNLEDFYEVDIKILDQLMHTIDEIAFNFSRLLRHRWLIAWLEVDFELSKTAIDMLSNYKDYGIRSFIDSFYAMEHCSGQLLVHWIVTECTDAAWDLYSILEYVREGNIYAIYDFLRKKQVKLPAIIHRYANMLPGTEYRQMQF